MFLCLQWYIYYNSLSLKEKKDRVLVEEQDQLIQCTTTILEKAESEEEEDYSDLFVNRNRMAGHYSDSSDEDSC